MCGVASGVPEDFTWTESQFWYPAIVDFGGGLTQGPGSATTKSPHFTPPLSALLLACRPGKTLDISKESIACRTLACSHTQGCTSSNGPFPLLLVTDYLFLRLHAFACLHFMTWNRFAPDPLPPHSSRAIEPSAFSRPNRNKIPTSRRSHR